MSATGLDVFDRTIHKTNLWLKDLMDLMECTDRHEAYLALRATLHALRDRLTVEEAAQFASQLPMLVRGFFYESYNPTGKPLKERHRDQFLAHIEREILPCPRDPEEAARAVFSLLVSRITQGEVRDIEQVLPREIRDLWPVATPQGRPE